MSYILAIDQGTTSSRAVVFDAELKPLAISQQEFRQIFPASGHVEHDPEEIWQSVLMTARDCIAKAGTDAGQIAAIGITNQRETAVLWDKTTGQALGNALVWQDRRTADRCDEMKSSGLEADITARTGLLLDPYFSASKLSWMLDNCTGARTCAEKGEIAFGTIDSWLIWKLTGGAAHKTDATNASRTMLFNIHDNSWDDELLRIFDIPRSVLPEVQDCGSSFGVCDPSLFGAAIPILGVAGDQQAATMGQACFEPGMMKSTYGTGCFALLNTGDDAVASHNQLLTTIAYRFNGRTTYALEGSIFIAGAVVQWLRDGLRILSSAEESGTMAEEAENHGRKGDEIILVPAFTGLGAPYWAPSCRGAVFGLTRDTGPEDLTRAALRSVAFQTRDLMEAMQADWGGGAKTGPVRVDGGMANSDWAMQAIADLLNTQVDRPVVTETTALGAGWIAGMMADITPGMEHLGKIWQLDRRFTPSMPDAHRNESYAAWKRAVEATMVFTGLEG